MGCCQSSSTESEVADDRNSPDALKPLHLIHVPNDTDQKVEATPSFGNGNRKFEFDTKEKEKDTLDIS